MELMSRRPLGFKIGLDQRNRKSSGTQALSPSSAPLGRQAICFSFLTDQPSLFLCSHGETGCFHCSFVHNDSLHQKRRVSHRLVAVSGVPDEVCLVQLKSAVLGQSTQVRLRTGSSISRLREGAHDNVFLAEQYDFQTVVPLGIQTQGIQNTASEVFDLNEKVSIFQTSDFYEELMVRKIYQSSEICSQA